jgi:hypothetical protein
MGAALSKADAHEPLEGRNGTGRTASRPLDDRDFDMPNGPSAAPVKIEP